jgi:hypothetical protein
MHATRRQRDDLEDELARICHQDGQHSRDVAD